MEWTTTATGPAKSIELIVWPSTKPKTKGTLIDLDALTSTETSKTFVGQDYITIRVDEKATDTGFAWNELSKSQPCLTMEDMNYGDFVTGYRQYLFQVTDLNCTDSLALVRSTKAKNSGDEYKINLSVTKKPCEIDQCPGQIQDLYMCNCIDLQASVGELFDFSV